MKKKDLLLALIGKLQKKGIVSRRAIVKCLFLLKKEYQIDSLMKFYSFYPYQQGLFSQVCYADLRALKQEGLVDEEETQLTAIGIEKLGEFDEDTGQTLDKLLDRFDSEEQITEYVYERYPEYTIKSKLVKRSVKGNAGSGFYTIGYEQKDIDSFMDVLIQNGIDVLVDVRKNPFSMNFAFMQKKLMGYLAGVDIDYLHIPELGVASEDRKNLDSKEDYEKLFLTYRESLPERAEHLDRVMEEGMSRRIALMCFEKDPAFCHRREIAGHIREHGHMVADL